MQAPACSHRRGAFANSSRIHPITRNRNSCVAKAIRARWCIDTKYGTKMEAVKLLQEWVSSIASEADGDCQSAAILSGNIGAPESRTELELEFESLAALETFWSTIPPVAHKAWSQRLQNIIIHGSPTWQVYRTVAVNLPTIEVPSPQSSGMRINAAALKRPTKELPPVSIPATVKQTSSGLSLVTSIDDASSILAADHKFISSQLASDRLGRNAAQSSKGDDDAMVGSDGSSDLEDTGMTDSELAASIGGVIIKESSRSGDDDDGLPFSSTDGVLRDWKGDPMTVNPKDRLPMKFL